MSAKRLSSLINPLNNGDLGNIVRRARDMGELAEALARALPPDEAASLVAANIREDGELVVVCRSPAWAARLRYEADTLLTAARQHGAAVERITIRVWRP